MIGGFLTQLILEPCRRRSLRLFVFRLCQFLHVRTNGHFDLLVRPVLAFFRPKRTLPASKLFPLADVRGVAGLLRRDGYAELSESLPADLTAALTTFAFTTGAYATDITENVRISPGQIPADHPRYDWRIGDLIAQPAVQAIVRDSYFHDIAQEYLGCRPRLSLIVLWLNPAFKGENSQYVFHYDNDGPAFVKFFVYLSEVTEESGPHVFICRSHSPIKPEQFHKGVRYEETALLAHYGAESKRKFVGPAGTMIAEDTMGFHRGSEVRRSHRLIFQLEYSLLDIPHAEEFEPGIVRVKFEGAHPAVREIVSKYYD